MTTPGFARTDRLLDPATLLDVSARAAEPSELAEPPALPPPAPGISPISPIGRLASSAAHGLNDIITVIQSYACILEDSHDVSDARRKDATEIRLAAERAAQLTRQLLSLGQPSAGAPKPTSLDERLACCLPALRRVLGASVAIEIQRGNVPPVIIDHAQFEQVVMDLAVGAREAMGGEGRVTIETSTTELDGDGAAIHGLAPGSYVVFALTDTGSARDPDTGEPGDLGLAFARGMAAQAGGALRVHSARGHGTTVRIWLPTTSDAAAIAVRAVAAAPRGLDPVTVLFVDAQREVRSVAARVLETSGCTVLAAATGAEARELCVTHDGAIDVVLLDAALSDGRGDLLVRAIRELRPRADVILMSGFPAGAIRSSGDAPVAVLAKPFTPAQLREAVAGARSAAPAARRPEASLQPRVLVVDDDPALRRMLTRLLKRAAFDVVVADTGRRALAVLESRPFDVILSDIHMPDGNGLELLRAVRRIDLDIPVILMSGKPDVESAATALELGAFRYLTKPLEAETVEKLVRNAARAHALARIRREAMTLAGGGEAGAADRAGLEVRFEQAMEKLWMAFQPIVEARSGALFGVEALMRSREPSIPTPPALLDAATQLKRMTVLGRRTRSLAGVAITARGDIPSLFVNLHPEDLLDVDLIDESSALAQIAPRVVLEVTEREALLTTPALTSRLERLRELGFRIAVDDIGAGYSGLTSFTELTPEIVKLDMALVRSIHASTVKQRTVGALCSLCHEMGTLVVGEGVETTDERDCLLSIGCDLLQGYLIARPSSELPLRA